MTIQCFDNGAPSLSVMKVINIQVLDSNEQPTNLLINGSTVTMLPENTPDDAVVGHLSCVDPDIGQRHVYSLAQADAIFKVSDAYKSCKHPLRLIITS